MSADQLLHAKQISCAYHGADVRRGLSKDTRPVVQVGSLVGFDWVIPRGVPIVGYNTRVCDDSVGLFDD